MQPIRLACVLVLLVAVGLCAVPSALVAPAAAVVGVSAATDACGTQPLKPDGTRWQCTFVDNFSGTTLDRTKWMPQTAFMSGTSSAYACYRDDPSNVSIRNGDLRLTLRELPAPAPCGLSGVAPTRFQAGSVSTWHLFSQQYGRFEARLKNTATTEPGLQEAFWLWPDDRVGTTTTWPFNGEIDISETYSHYPLLSVPFLHYSADLFGPLVGTNTAWDCLAERGVWNTYGLDWSPSRLEVFVNGKSCLVNTSGDPAFQKPYIVAFTSLLGMGANAYDGRAPLPATLYVDYIRVWK